MNDLGLFNLEHSFNKSISFITNRGKTPILFSKLTNTHSFLLKSLTSSTRLDDKLKIE